MLLLIDLRYCCCGVELRDGVVTLAAPIVKYMKGWTLEKVEKYVKSKGGHCYESNLVNKSGLE